MYNHSNAASHFTDQTTLKRKKSAARLSALRPVKASRFKGWMHRRSSRAGWHTRDEAHGCAWGGSSRSRGKWAKTKGYASAWASEKRTLNEQRTAMMTAPLRADLGKKSSTDRMSFENAW